MSTTLSPASRPGSRPKRLFRELLPHALWRVIEVIGASVIAWAYALYAKFINGNVTKLAIALIFFAALSVLVVVANRFFDGINDSLAYRFGQKFPPAEVAIRYLKIFRDRKRSPEWDDYLESETIIEKEKFSIADVNFSLASLPADESIALENVGRVRTVTVPRFVRRLLSSSGLGPDRYRDSDNSARVFVFLGRPASGKSSLMIQIARWTAVQASASGQYPVPVYINLTHFGKQFSADMEGLTRLVRMSVRQGCPRYLSFLAEQAGTPLDDTLARTFTAPSFSNPLLYILDGLDEVPPEQQRTEQHKERIQAIAAFIEARPRHLFLVTCRQEDYVALRSYKNSFGISIKAIQPWSRKLFYSYVAGRLSMSHQNRRLVKSFIATANDDETFGPLRNTPLLAVMFLAWPLSKKAPTLSQLWEQFIRIRLRDKVEDDDAYDRCIEWLTRLGMYLTVEPENSILPSDPASFEAARRAGLLADTVGPAGDLEFAIKPLQQYFAACYILQDISRDHTDFFPLAHQRYQYAARLLIAMAKEDSFVLEYLAAYLNSSPDVHEAAKRFAICMQSLTVAQLKASSLLEDALISVVDRVLTGDDNGDMLCLIDGIKSLPDLLSSGRERAVLLLGALVSLGSLPVQRRLLQLFLRAPRVLRSNPVPFLVLSASLLNRGVFTLQLCEGLRVFPASSNAVRMFWRALSKAILALRPLGIGLYLYAAYLLSIWVGNRIAVHSAAWFGARWSFFPRLVVVPHDAAEIAIRTFLFAFTALAPWLIVKRFSYAGFSHLSLPSRILTMIVVPGFLRCLILLPILGLLAVRTMPSGLEFAFTLVLAAMPLLMLFLGAWSGNWRVGSKTGSSRSDGDIGMDPLPIPIPVPEPPGPAPIEQTHSPAVAWYSRLLAWLNSAGLAISSPRRRWALGLMAMLAVAIVSLLHVHRLDLIAIFEIVGTVIALYGGYDTFKRYRDLSHELENLRGELAWQARDDYERTLAALCAKLENAKTPRYKKKKYIQFMASDLLWDRRLVEYMRNFLAAEKLSGEVKSDLEILINTKIPEVEMHENPGLTEEQIRRLLVGKRWS